MAVELGLAQDDLCLGAGAPMTIAHLEQDLLSDELRGAHQGDVAASVGQARGDLDRLIGRQSCRGSGAFADFHGPRVEDADIAGREIGIHQGARTRVEFCVQKAECPVSGALDSPAPGYDSGGDAVPGRYVGDGDRSRFIFGFQNHRTADGIARPPSIDDPVDDDLARSGRAPGQVRPQGHVAAVGEKRGVARQGDAAAGCHGLGIGVREGLEGCFPGAQPDIAARGGRGQGLNQRSVEVRLDVDIASRTQHVDGAAVGLDRRADDDSAPDNDALSGAGAAIGNPGGLGDEIDASADLLVALGIPSRCARVDGALEIHVPGEGGGGEVAAIGFDEGSGGGVDLGPREGDDPARRTDIGVDFQVAHVGIRNGVFGHGLLALGQVARGECDIEHQVRFRAGVGHIGVGHYTDVRVHGEVVRRQQRKGCEAAR